MSYVSKVRIGVTKEGLRFLEDYSMEKLGEDKYLNSCMNNYKVFVEKGNIRYIGWDWIDFCENNLDVKVIYEALDVMDNEEIPYRMAIVGEDYMEYGAIEIKDNDPFDIIPYILTTIEFVYGDEHLREEE